MSFDYFLKAVGVKCQCHQDNIEDRDTGNYL